MSLVDPNLAAHYERSALLVVDTQNDFADDGRCPIEGTTAIVPRLAELVEAFREAGRPIVHVVRLYRGEDVDLVRRGLVASGHGPVAPGTPGSQLIKPLGGAGEVTLDHDRLIDGALQRLGPEEVAMWKPRWSAFHRTPLHRHLQAHHVDTVVIAGCNFPNCPRATVFDASSHDYRIVLATDALSGLTTQHLTDMRSIGTDAATTDQIQAALTSTPR